MKQISIVTPQNPAVLTQITEALANKQINIENIDAITFKEATVIILSTDKYDETLQVIHQLPNMHAVSEDAILIRLNSEPGALAKIARRFSDAQITIRSIRFIQRDEHSGLVAIATERSADALNLVADVLVS